VQALCYLNLIILSRGGQPFLGDKRGFLRRDDLGI